MWRPVVCTYRGVILGSGGGSSSVKAAESEYFAIDNVLFDMYPALTGDGSMGAAAPPGHMVTWMNVYFTEPGLRQFKAKFARDAALARRSPKCSGATRSRTWRR